jgi:hypothetical protein
VILGCKYNCIDDRETRESLTVGVLVLGLACKSNYGDNRERRELLTQTFW